MSSQREEEANSPSRRPRRRSEVSFKEVVRALGGDPNSLGMERSSVENIDDESSGEESDEATGDEPSGVDPKDNWVKTFRRSPRFDDLVSGLGDGADTPPAEARGGEDCDGEFVDTQEVDTGVEEATDEDATLNGRIASMVATVSPFGSGEPGGEAGTFEVEGLDEGVTIGQLTSGFGTSIDTPTWREVAVDQVRRSREVRPDESAKPRPEREEKDDWHEGADGIAVGDGGSTASTFEEPDTRRISASDGDAEAGAEFEQPVTRRISEESSEASGGAFDDETTRRVPEEVAAFPESQDPEKVLGASSPDGSAPAAVGQVDRWVQGEDSSWGDEPTQSIEGPEEPRVEGPVAFHKEGSGPKIVSQESFGDRYRPEAGIPASVDARSAEQTRPEIRPSVDGFEDELAASQATPVAESVEPEEPVDEDAGTGELPGPTSLLEDSDAEFFSDVSVHGEPGALGESEAEVSGSADVEVEANGSPGVPAVSRPDTGNVGLAAAESELEWEAPSGDSHESLGDGAQTDEIAALLDGPNSSLVEASATVLERRSWAESTSEADDLARRAEGTDEEQLEADSGESTADAGVDEPGSGGGADVEPRAAEGFDWDSAAEIVDESVEDGVEESEAEAVGMAEASAAEADAAEVAEDSEAAQAAAESEAEEAEMAAESEAAQATAESEAEMAAESEEAEVAEESEADAAEMVEESEAEAEAAEMTEESEADAAGMVEDSEAAEAAAESEAEMAAESEAAQATAESEADAAEMVEELEAEAAEVAEESEAEAEAAEMRKESEAEAEAAEMAEESEADAAESAEDSEAAQATAESEAEDAEDAEMAAESEEAEGAEESEAAEAAETADKSEAAEMTEGAESAVKAAEVAEESEADAAEMAEESEADAAEMVEELEAEAAEMAEPEVEVEATEMAEGSEAEAAEVAEESEAEAAGVVEDSESAQAAEESEADAAEMAVESEGAEVAAESEAEAAETAEELEAEAAEMAAESEAEAEAAEMAEESEADAAENAEAAAESEAEDAEDAEMAAESEEAEVAEESEADAAESAEDSEAAHAAAESEAEDAEMAAESEEAEGAEESEAAEAAETAEESEAAEMTEGAESEVEAAEVGEESEAEAEAAEMVEESEAAEAAEAVAEESEPIVSSNSIVEEAEDDEQEGAVAHRDADYELVEVASETSRADANHEPRAEVAEVAAAPDSGLEAIDSPDFRALGSAASSLFEAVTDRAEASEADEAVEAVEAVEPPEGEDAAVVEEASEDAQPTALARLQTKKVRVSAEVVETSRPERSFTFRSPTEGRMRKPNLPPDEEDFDPREVAALGIDDSTGVLFEEVDDDDDSPADPFASRRPVSAQSLREQFFGEVQTSVGVTSVDKGLPKPSTADTRPKQKPNPLFKKLVQGRIPSPIKASDTDVDALEQENVLSNFRDRFEKKKAEMKEERGSTGSAPKAQVLKPAKEVREERRKAWLRERVAPSRVDRPKISQEENLVMTRQVEVKAKKTEYQETVRVPVLSDFNQRREESGSGALVNSENEILRLYRDFMIVMRRCGLATRPIDFASFADRVSDQRERARRKYGADNLVMEVKVTSGKPVISIRPR